jgi:hypothetical protein
MAATYNDGAVPYGSRVLTINAVTYVADAFTITRGTKIIERNNELGEPSGWVAVATVPTGTATLQLAAAATAIPTLGLTFTITEGTFALIDVGQPEGEGDTKKVTISFRKDIVA